MSGAGLQLDTLELRLRGDLLARLSLTVAPGEVVSLMAASGSGKSSLLAALIGALPPGFVLTGGLRLNGRDLIPLPTAARRIGLMFQEDILFDHLSVGENLAFGLPPGGSRAARRAEVDAALAEAGLEGFAPAIRPHSQADSAPVLPCCAPCWRGPRRCCWMNPSRGWMRVCATRSAASPLPAPGRAACR